MSSLSNITVAILAGGMGTRLASVLPNQQKTLAPVNNHYFLEHILDQLNKHGFKQVVLCTGYLSDQVEEKLGGKYKNINLIYSKENSSLGTGGALRSALLKLESETILVMNGDSYCDINFEDFLQFHNTKKAYASLAVTQVPEISKFGKVILGDKDQIEKFEEKKEGKEGWISVGIYLLNKSLIADIPANKELSLEKEVFPKLINKVFYGFKTNNNFIDIGTPQSYSQANDFFKNISKKRFILLDRDGTLIIHKPYLSDPDQIELIPKAVEALKEFKKIGFGVVVITNQSGVGRGYFNLETLEKIHQRLSYLLAQEGVFLDDIYFCPHTPEDNCLCRKPKIELVMRAAKKHHFNPKLCIVIGDNESDIALGRNIRATTILVRTGHDAEVEKEKKINSNFVADSLKDTLSIIKKLIEIDS